MRFLIACMSLALCTLAQAKFLTPEETLQDKAEIKVLAFLSDQCPCSRSHKEHLNNLSKTYSYPVYGVISEPISDSKRLAYFRSGFNFPIVRDPKQLLVKKYKALKTPHSVILKNNAPIYEGGVTNKRNFKKATSKFLEENLKLLSQNKKLKHRYGKALGCYIKRF